MKVLVKVYNGCKYNNDTKKVAEVEYDNIIGFEVKQVSDDEIYAMGFDECDEYAEYLIITFENGETATFRNSHIDMFRIK